MTTKGRLRTSIKDAGVYDSAGNNDRLGIGSGDGDGGGLDKYCEGYRRLAFLANSRSKMLRDSQEGEGTISGVSAGEISLAAEVYGDGVRSFGSTRCHLTTWRFCSRVAAVSAAGAGAGGGTGKGGWKMPLSS